jgi:RNase H-fold protein (predicted Holliday junction resolvase)
MKKIIGLDLGTTSIGWAVVNEAENDSEKSSIERLGVRVNPLTVDERTNFEKGKPITTAKVDEVLQFRVMEFNKNNRKITLSHTKLFEEAKKEESRDKRKESDSETTSTQKAVKKLKANLEKTTLGDISELAALKSEMESRENE